MKKRKSFSISKIMLANSNVSSLARLLEKIYYNNESGFGVAEIEIIDEILSALLIKRNSTFIQEYNISEKTFEKKLIYVFSTVRFYIDFEFNLMYTEGPPTNLLQAKALLRNISELSFEALPLDASPYKIYGTLKSKKIKFQLSEISIENFNYNDGAVGKFIAIISNMRIGVELIKSYKEDISKIAFMFDSYKVYFYSNNTFSIVGNPDDIEQNLKHFKNIIS